MSSKKQEKSTMNDDEEIKPYEGKITEDSMVGDKYYVVQKLGDGCYAKVYLVQDTTNDRVYALKAINKKHFKTNYKLRHMLDKEARIHGMLNHPNIVKMERYFEDKNYVFFLLEYVHPGEIFPILYEKKGFSEARTAGYIYQVIQALKYCQSKDILHRDIKPENLLLNEKGIIKLADFGWATVGNGNSVVGSVNYNSPEMLRYEKYDYRSDIWAVGVLIYELLCCQQPFRGVGRTRNEKEKDTEKLIKRCKIHYNKYTARLTPEALDLIQKILVLNPQERPTYDEILSHPWFKINLTDTNFDYTEDNNVISEIDEDASYDSDDDNDEDEEDKDNQNEIQSNDD